MCENPCAIPMRSLCDQSRVKSTHLLAHMPCSSTARILVQTACTDNMAPGFNLHTCADMQQHLGC